MADGLHSLIIPPEKATILAGWLDEGCVTSMERNAGEAIVPSPVKRAIGLEALTDTRPVEEVAPRMNTYPPAAASRTMKADPPASGDADDTLCAMGALFVRTNSTGLLRRTASERAKTRPANSSRAEVLT
ncbi:MAG: hypothetical protein DI596_02955 [Azospira oryzae]|nr:MAG: hypothetical protein DI596_02955 [Azospira oryzae]PZP81974.1 MAG: hypothetical protein DI593_02955 [Azospira oryzae]